MTTLTITPDVAKKKMRLDGVIAAGETVAVTVKGFGGKSVTDTRLRVYCGKDLIAIYPKDPAEGEQPVPWSVDGDDLACELDLFTVQAEKATRCGCAECLFILDDLSAKVLYASKDKEILKWIKRGGADIPYDLSGYPDIIASFREEIADFKTSVVGTLQTYEQDINNAWSAYKQTIQSLYDSFTQTVRGLVDGKASEQELAGHIGDKNNPHEVKIAQIPQLRSELNNLGSRITNESTARENADDALRESVIAESNRAVAKENELAGAISGESDRATQAEGNLDLAIRQLGNRVDSAIKVLSGRTFSRPSSDRERTELIVELVTALGGTVL